MPKCPVCGDPTGVRCCEFGADVEPRYLVATVHELPVPAGGDVEDAWDDWTRAPERAGALYATNAIPCRPRDIEDPDFDLRVLAHGRQLDADDMLTPMQLGTVLALLTDAKTTRPVRMVALAAAEKLKRLHGLPTAPVA